MLLDNMCISYFQLYLCVGIFLVKFNQFCPSLNNFSRIWVHGTKLVVVLFKFDAYLGSLIKEVNFDAFYEFNVAIMLDLDIAISPIS